MSERKVGEVYTDYVLETLLDDGTVSDCQWFETREEAQKELEFNRKHYPEYRYRIGEQKVKVLFKASK